MNEKERLSALQEIKNSLKNRKKDGIKKSPGEVQRDIKRYIQSLDNRLRDIINKVLNNPSSMLSSFVSVATIGVKATTKFFVKTYKFFIQCVSQTFKLAIKVIKMVMRGMTGDDITYIGSFIVGSLLFGVIGACTVMSVGVWGVYTGRMMNNIEKKYSSIHDGIVDIEKRLKGDKVDIPDEFMPPKTFKGPDMTFTVCESMAASAGVYIVVTILLKAVIVQQFNEEVHKRTKVVKGLFTPTSLTLGLLTSALMMGSKVLMVM